MHINRHTHTQSYAYRIHNYTHTKCEQIRFFRNIFIQFSATSHIFFYIHIVCVRVFVVLLLFRPIYCLRLYTHATWYGLVKQMLLLVFGRAYLDVWAATRPDVDRWYLFYSYRSSMLCVCALFVRCVRFWPLIVSRCVRVRACVCLSDSNIMRLCTETKPPKPKTTLCELKTK